MYSAIKQDGRKLYDLARQGLTVEREPRPVTIHALTLTDWQPPEFTLEVTCSAGTYIRSLAYDIGETLGVGAHLTALARTRSGAFRLEQAIDLDTLTHAADWSAWLLKPSVALADWPHLTLDDAALDHIAHGRAVPQESHADEGTLAAAFDSTGELVALVRAFERQWQPYKVFLTEHNAE
jgi:tRNA pseudouridine55 synthase